MVIQPPYLHHLISVQPTRSTRCSSLVTLARPSTSPSQRVADRCFRYASPCLWNQLPGSFRQPCYSPFISVLLVHAPSTSSHSANSPLSPSITPFSFSLVSRPTSFTNFCPPFNHRLPSSLKTGSTDPFF